MADGITEFCCRSGGSNLNAGTLVGDSTEPGTSPSFIYESGNWDSSTGEFVVASGNPSSDGVAVTQYASVYVSGTGVTGFIGQVSAVSTTGITIDLTDHYAGTAPSTSSGDRSLRIGGAWQGPNGAEGFPLDFIGDLAASGSDTVARVNMKNDQTYAITASIMMPTDNFRTIQGYSTSYGDKGEAEIQGPATGTSFKLIDTQNTNSNGNWLIDLFFNQNGDAAGSDYGVQLNNGNLRSGMIRCRVANMYKHGVFVTDSNVLFYDCAFHDNGGHGCWNNGGVDVLFESCCFNNNVNDGCYVTTGQSRNGVFNNCIFALNGNHGLDHTTDYSVFVTNCTFYKNSQSGMKIRLYNGYVVNNSFFLNGNYGIDADYIKYTPAFLKNNAFGTGTQANGLGNYNLGSSGGTGGVDGWVETDGLGTVEEVADFNPYTDPDNGDFTLVSGSSLVATGYGHTQRNPSFTGTSWRRIIGASGPVEGGGGGGASSYSFFS